MDGDVVRRWEGGDVDLTRRLPSDLILAAAEREPRIGPATGGYVSMLQLPSCLDPVEPLAREVYRSGWRPAFTPGPTRRELRDVVAAALRTTDAASSAPLSPVRRPSTTHPPAQAGWFCALSSRRSCSGEVAQLARKRSAWWDGRAGLGRVGDQRLAGVAGELQRLVGEREVADDAVVEVLGAGGVPADVVRGPQGAEPVAAGGQLADELGEYPVVGVAAGLGAQQRDAVAGGAVPVRVEVRRARVEERVPGVVRRAARRGRGRRRRRTGRRTGPGRACWRRGRPAGRSGRTPGRRSSRPAAAARPGRTRWAGRRRGGAWRSSGARARSNRWARSASSSCSARASASSTLSETPCALPALEPGVVLDADAGEQRDLLAAQPGDAPVAAVRRADRPAAG